MVVEGGLRIQEEQCEVWVCVCVCVCVCDNSSLPTLWLTSGVDLSSSYLIELCGLTISYIIYT